MRELWGSITTEEHTEICRRMAVGCYYLTLVEQTLWIYLKLFILLWLQKLPSCRISWPLSALFLCRVHPVHSFVARRKPTQALRPCRQQLLSNRLLCQSFVSRVYYHLQNYLFFLTISSYPPARFPRHVYAKNNDPPEPLFPKPMIHLFIVVALYV